MNHSEAKTSTKSSGKKIHWGFIRRWCVRWQHLLWKFAQNQVSPSVMSENYCLVVFNSFESCNSEIIFSCRLFQLWQLNFIHKVLLSVFMTARAEVVATQAIERWLSVRVGQVWIRLSFFSTVHLTYLISICWTAELCLAGTPSYWKGSHHQVVVKREGFFSRPMAK